MLPISQILVPIDFSECSRQAFLTSLLFARRYKAKATVFHVISSVTFGVGEIGVWQTSDQEMARLLQSAQEQLLNLLSMPDTAGLDITQQVVWGIPPLAILEQVREERVDLIVMGTHGSTGLQHFILGSVAEHIVRTAPCPVLTIREETI